LRDLRRGVLMPWNRLILAGPCRPPPSAPAQHAWRRVPPPPSFSPPPSTPRRSAVAAYRERPDRQAEFRDVLASPPAIPPSAPVFRTIPRSRPPAPSLLRRLSPTRRGPASSHERSERLFAISALPYRAVQMSSTWNLDEVKLEQDQVAMVDWRCHRSQLCVARHGRQAHDHTAAPVRGQTRWKTWPAPAPAKDGCGHAARCGAKRNQAIYDRLRHPWT
jgi:hypothetical protein